MAALPHHGSIGRALDAKILAACSNSTKLKLVGPNSISMNGRHVLFPKTVLDHVRQELTCSAHLVRQPWKLARTVAAKCISFQTQDQPADVSDEEISASKTTTTIPSSEVQSLLTDICDTTSIAEFKLNLGSFHLYVKRDINGIDSSMESQIAHSVPVELSHQVPATNGSVSVTSLVKVERSPVEIQTFDAASYGGLMILQAPKVGLFRRCRERRGRLLPPPCEENQEVKKGQIVGFMEQLGCVSTIKTDIGGLLIKILKEDGDAVGYGDDLMAIMPS